MSMELSHVRRFAGYRILVALTLIGLAVPLSGCHTLLATGVYLWQGGNSAPAECDALRNERVVVVCRPPSSQEYSYADASRSIAQRVSKMLVENVKGIDVVDPRDVDKWVDESDWGDFRELAKAVRAKKVVQIELDDFQLYKGKTLYQGHAVVAVRVYDMKDNNVPVWERDLGEILYPVNSGIPAQDKPVQQFEREFVSIISQRVAEHFYPHDPNASFAIDALANR
jgi:hypothetical protein